MSAHQWPNVQWPKAITKRQRLELFLLENARDIELVRLRLDRLDLRAAIAVAGRETIVRVIHERTT